MADVETEQRTLGPQAETDNPSASIALNEENLEALLNAVTGAPAPAQRPRAQGPPSQDSPSQVSPSQDPPSQVSASQAAESPAPVVTSPVIASPIAASPIVASTVPAAEPEPTSETYSAPEVQPAAAVSSAQGVIQEVRTEKVDAAPLPVERSTPPATETAPAVDPQQDVFSKLALISSIKQRRAVTMRPDGTGPASEAATPAQAPVTRYVEPAATRNAAPMPQSKQPPEAALLAVPVPFAAAPTVTAGSTPAAPAAVPMDVRSPEKPSLPAKKVWSNSPGTPRRDESKAPSATPVLAQPAPSQTYVSAETARTGAPADGAKSFLTSKAGIGVIAGAVLAGGLTVFFLTGHGKAANAAKSKVTESAQAASTASPVVPAVTDQSSDGKPSTDKTSAATAPRVDAKTGAKQEPPPAARPGVPQTTAAQQPPASLQPTAAVPPPVTESTRTIARAFTPPTPSAGPANSQILEAPPALNAGAAAPAGVAVPARIAPLPPPPAPRAAPSPAPNATQPRQVVVTGKAQATKLIHQVLPNYPALAKTARVQGTVRFRVTIGADGHVKTLTTLGGPLPLVTAASEAVKQWLYEPTVADGQAVEVISEIDVAFAL